MENNCQDKAHDYEPCENHLGADVGNGKDISVTGLLVPNNELEKFKELYYGYDYSLIKHDEEHYFAYGFVSFKENKAKILTQELEKMNAVKPVYLPSDYSKKAKHTKTEAQKQNSCEKRRSKNKAARKAKKRK